MRASSLDVRERIVAAVDEGQEIEEVAERYQVHARTVRRYVKLMREQGSLAAKARPGRPVGLSPEQQQHFADQLREEPSLSYPERARLFLQQGVLLSGASISRWVKRLGYSRKKSSSDP